MKHRPAGVGFPIGSPAYAGFVEFRLMRRFCEKNWKHGELLEPESLAITREPLCVRELTPTVFSRCPRDNING